MSSHEIIGRVFDRVVRCFADGDRQAFLAMCGRPDNELLHLFDRNADKLKNHNWQLHLRTVNQEGGLAALTFDVVDASGEVVDKGELCLGLEADGDWRVLQL